MNQRGLATVYVLYLIPLLLAVFYALYLLFGFSDSNLEMTQTCLKEQIKIQEQVKKSLRSLFSLNKKAQSLRAQYHRAKLQYVAAQSTGNSPAATAARVKMSILWEKRVLLDLQQKSLIKATNSFIRSSQEALNLKMHRLSKDHEERFAYFLKLKVTDLNYKDVSLAVRPDMEGPAPTYSFKNNFLEDQALEVSWTLKAESQGVSANFLPSNSSYNQKCSTTINHKENEWPTVTVRGKSLLKPSS